MPLTVSNNTAVAAASYHLGKNQQALQLSIKKLASGSRLIGNPDPGTLSVAMKLNASGSSLAPTVGGATVTAQRLPWARSCRLGALCKSCAGSC